MNTYRLQLFFPSFALIYKTIQADSMEIRDGACIFYVRHNENGNKHLRIVFSSPVQSTMVDKVEYSQKNHEPAKI